MTYSKISILFKSVGHPPYFIGSQLRGAFGYALKKVTCINPSYKCEGCFATLNCLYYEFYEAKNEIQKYRLDFKLNQPFYEFDFYLFEEATIKLPYVVSALHMMLTQIGLGKEKTTYQDFEIFVNDENILLNGKLTLPQNFIKKVQLSSYVPNIKIKFITPLRIKKENKFVRDNHIELHDILNSIYQRQLKMQNEEFQKIPHEIQGEIVKKQIRYEELTRKSNRQKTTMNLGGIIGEIQINNIDEQSYHILKLGEILACGKSTVFGLGKIEIEDLHEEN